jgi:peptidyl-prolyl cis-trans isomerase B (cyclophilin B)
MKITRETYHRPARLLARAGVLIASLAACGDAERAASASASTTSESAARAAGPHAIAAIEIAELGTLRIELMPEFAPRTVANFEALAAQGFYDGTTFHRVIPGFMIQGGDPNTRDADPRNDGSGSAAVELPSEPSAWSHRRGTVSWATQGRSPSGSQFFIVVADSPHLDGRHNVIGRVVSGMEIADRVTQLEIDTYGRYGPRNRPYPVEARIARIRIEPAQSAAPSAESNAVALAAQGS